MLLYNICLQVARLCSAVADRQSDSVQAEGAVPSPQQLQPTAEEIENAGTSALYCRPDRERECLECCDVIAPRAMAEGRAPVVLSWSSEAGGNDGKGSGDLH